MLNACGPHSACSGVCIRLKTLLERAFPQKTAQRRLELKAAESGTPQLINSYTWLVVFHCSAHNSIRAQTNFGRSWIDRHDAKAIFFPPWHSSLIDEFV